MIYDKIINRNLLKEEGKMVTNISDVLLTIVIAYGLSIILGGLWGWVMWYIQLSKEKRKEDMVWLIVLGLLVCLQWVLFTIRVNAKTESTATLADMLLWFNNLGFVVTILLWVAESYSLPRENRKWILIIVGIVGVIPLLMLWRWLLTIWN